MSKSENLISRLSRSDLESKLGSQTISLLEQLDLQALRNTYLSKIILKIFGEDILLNDPMLRSDVLSALKLNDAIELTKYFTLENVDPYQYLNDINFKRLDNKMKFAEWLGIDLKAHNSHLEIENLSRPKINTINPTYGLFPHQIDAVNRIMDFLSIPKGRAVLHMPTGAGKTRSAMNVVSHFFRDYFDKEVIVWLTDREELCEQAAAEFEKAWETLGNRPIKVIRHFGQLTSEPLSIENDTFIVISLQSANSMLGNQNDAIIYEMLRRTGLIIIDEAHMATAPTYQHVLNMLTLGRTTRLLGLTATPGRSYLDPDQDIRLADFFNRNKVTLKVEGYSSPIQYLIKNQYLSEVHTSPLLYEGGSMIRKNPDDLELDRKELNTVSEDVERNRRILLRIKEQSQKGHQILVFACNVKHAQMLTAALIAEDQKAACIIGVTNTYSRAQDIRNFKENKINILCTVNVLTTGFDAPNADVAIIAKPTQSIVMYTQMVGRVMRGVRQGGTKTCKVITVVDKKYGFENLDQAFTFWDDLWE